MISLLISYEIPISMKVFRFLVIGVYYYDTNKKYNIFLAQIFPDINILVIFRTVFIIFIIYLPELVFNYIQNTRCVVPYYILINLKDGKGYVIIRELLNYCFYV